MKTRINTTANRRWEKCDRVELSAVRVTPDDDGDEWKNANPDVQPK